MNLAVLTPFRRLACAALIAIACNGLVQGQEGPQKAITPAPTSNHPGEAAQIRQHHLNRLHEQINVEPAVLASTCRYESDIATAPPVNQIALTFDDGPDPEATAFILAVLKKHNVPATFFMIGEKVRRYPDVVAAVRAAGHVVIANHSWNHPNFHAISAAVQADEITRTEELATDASPKLFRYPYGNATCDANTLLHARGYKIVGWHIDSCDWAYDRTGSVDVKEALSCGVPAQYRHDYAGHVVAAARARKGGIILMHEIHPHTLAKLDTIIDQLLAAGFVFGAITDPAFAASLR